MIRRVTSVALDIGYCAVRYRWIKRLYRHDDPWPVIAAWVRALWIESMPLPAWPPPERWNGPAYSHGGFRE